MKTILLILTFTILHACGKKDSTGDNMDGMSSQPSLEIFNGKIQASPNDPLTYFQRGSHYFETGIYSEAIRDLIRCTELDSSRIDCWHLLADAYLEDNRSRPAIEALEDYLKIDPKHIPTLLKIATFQTVIKKYTPAHFHLNAVLKQDRTNAQALFKKGLIYHYEGKPLEAVEYLQQAIQSDPDLVDGHLLLGQLFEDAGNPLAQRFYENAIRVDPKNEEAKMALANLYWMANDYTTALDLYNQLLSDHPEYAKGHFNRGLIHLELDSLSIAQKAFERAISIDPNFVQAHFYLGETFDLKGEWVKAEDALNEAARLSPTDPKISSKIQEVKDKIQHTNK